MLDLFLEACRRNMNMLLRLNTVNQAGGVIADTARAEAAAAAEELMLACWAASQLIHAAAPGAAACLLPVCLSVR